MDAFTMSYIKTALWSSVDDYGLPMNTYLSVDWFAPETLESIKNDCEKFQRDNAELIGDKVVYAGRDFWLTRNHHGAGFWDGGWEENIGQELTKVSHTYKECNLYVGDDGMIYFMN